MPTHNLEKMAGIFEARRDRSMVDYMRASPEERAHIDRILIERDLKRKDAIKKQLSGWKDNGSYFYNRLVSGKNS